MFEKNKWQTCVQRDGLKESVERTYGKTMNKENTWDQKTEIGILEVQWKRFSERK